MRRVLRFELERAFRKKSMLLALAIGIVIVLIQIITVVLPASKDILGVSFTGMNGEYPENVFNRYICLDPMHPYNEIYFTVFPIIAMLPFGVTYFSDRKNGYIKNICTRTKRVYYIISKYLVTFLTGGLCVTIPLMIGLLITAALLPSLVPVCNNTFVIMGGHMFSRMFFEHPYAYIFMYFGVYFLYGGAFATIALSVSCLFDYAFFVMISPFAVYYLLGILSTYFKSSLIGNYKVQLLLSMYQILSSKYIVFWLMWLIITVITFAVHILGGLKRDIF